MTVLAEALLLGLVAYRLWRLVAVDGVTERPRGWVFRRVPAVSDLVECPWCLGSWIAIAVTAPAWAAGLVSGSPWLLAPAAAAVCGLIGEAAS